MAPSGSCPPQRPASPAPGRPPRRPVDAAFAGALGRTLGGRLAYAGRASSPTPAVSWRPVAGAVQPGWHPKQVGVLFDSDVRVDYGFIYVDSGVGGWDQDVDQRAGQRNGLLGAAQPGFLQVWTSMQTGFVRVRVEAHEAAPPVDDTCDEIVEASCDLRGPDVMLSAFDWAETLAMPRGGRHRVRLSARDYGAGELERYERHEPVRDSYLLQLWPAPMAPDEVVKVTSASAAYRHGVAFDHPTAPASPHDRALVEQHERHAAVERSRASERAQYLQRWGGTNPSARLLQVQEHALALSADRRDLLDAIAALPAEQQRALAVNLARQACAADDGPLDWQPALDALAAGRPLPAPFDDAAAVFSRLFPGPATITMTGAYFGSWPPPREPLHKGISADGTVRAASAPDPLEAALGAVHAASWSAPDLDAYFAGVADVVALG